MSRDHFLFLVIGLLSGFIAGYLVHESMSNRQPAPLWHGAGTAQAPAQPGNPSAGAASAPAAGTTQGAGPQAMAAMEQVQRLRAYVEENPTDLDALRSLANMNYDIANWQRAAELYERLLDQKADDVDAMTDLGACYRNLGRFDDALRLFRQAREQKPSHWQARYNEILVIAFDQGNPQGAVESLTELKKMQPENPDVNRLAAELERRLGR